ERAASGRHDAGCLRVHEAGARPAATTVLPFQLSKTMSQSLKLTPEMDRFAEEQVHAGNFESVDEVARTASPLLRENARRRETVREELSGLFEEMDAGKGIPTTDEDFARMVREHGAKHREQ